MNIHSTLTQLSRNIAIKYDTHGLTADGLQWLKTETFAGLYDSQYGPGVLINFSISYNLFYEMAKLNTKFEFAYFCIFCHIVGTVYI